MRSVAHSDVSGDELPHSHQISRGIRDILTLNHLLKSRVGGLFRMMSIIKNDELERGSDCRIFENWSIPV